MCAGSITTVHFQQARRDTITFLSHSIWSTVQVARFREFRMAYLTGAFPRMDRGLHSSWTRIEFDFFSPDTGAVHDVSLNDWPVFNVGTGQPMARGCSYGASRRRASP